MAERKRDYHAEYERRKANGWVRPPRDSKEEYAKEKARGYKRDSAKIYEQRKQSGKVQANVTISMSQSKKQLFDYRIALHNDLTEGEKITRSGLINKWIDMYLNGKLE